MTVDVLFLIHNRKAFTEAALQALVANTDWKKINHVFLYDDMSSDGAETLPAFYSGQIPVDVRCIRAQFGSPVAVMNHYLSALDASEAHLFAKIDSDTMMPPGWLDACLGVMDSNPSLDLLGVEAHNPVDTGKAARWYSPAEYIGGIGMMRQSSFITLPRPSGLFGFTAWQTKSPWLRAGWISPALPVFLLDHLPREPWQTLSKEYTQKGWQRQTWGTYTEEQKNLWAWWGE